MKEWFTWMLLAAGLLLAFAFWPVERPMAQTQKQTVTSSASVGRGGEHPAAVPARSPAQTFAEYPCNSLGCRGHKRGYRWAQDHAITDADDCTGNSGAFIEGCRVYAVQNAPPNWIDPRAGGD